MLRSLVAADGRAGDPDATAGRGSPHFVHLVSAKPANEEFVDVPELVRLLFSAPGDGFAVAATASACEPTTARRAGQCEERAARRTSSATPCATPRAARSRGAGQREGRFPPCATRASASSRIAFLRLTEQIYHVTAAPASTGGTGLRLAIVKHVPSRHQAPWRPSEPGRGSTFGDFPGRKGPWHSRSARARGGGRGGRPGLALTNPG
jgi:hypothetical protein